MYVSILVLFKQYIYIWDGINEVFSTEGAMQFFSYHGEENLMINEWKILYLILMKRKFKKNLLVFTKNFLKKCLNATFNKIKMIILKEHLFRLFPSKIKIIVKLK